MSASDTAYFDLRISEDDTIADLVKEHQMNGCHHLKYNLYCLIFACEINQIGNHSTYLTMALSMY